MRTLFDSVTAGDIPRTCDLVAGYIDGAFAWTDADWALFPEKVKVRIATSWLTNDGHVLDVETGDATPEEAPIWVQRRRAAGADPSVYTGAADWPAVISAFKAAGVAQPHYWIARWDNDPRPILGAVAKQYANPDLTGGHWDASSVADHWPGVDDMTDDELRAALKRIYSGPDSPEEWVKADVRVMIEQDPETRAAIAAQAIRAVGQKLTG